MARNLRLTFCCGMAKSRDRLIFIGAPWLRYFAKQNFRAEITQGKVCKCKWLHISRLTMSSGTVCNKKAQKREQMGPFAWFQPSIHTVSAVETILKDAICHRQRASLRTQKGTNATIKGRLWQDKRPQRGLPEAVSHRAAGIFPLTHCHHSMSLSLLFDTAGGLRRPGATSCYKTLKTSGAK